MFEDIDVTSYPDYKAPEVEYGKDRYLGERGTSMDLLSHAYRGGINFLDLAGKATDTAQDILGMEDPYEEGDTYSRLIQGARETSFAKPDISEYWGDENFAKRWVGGALESIPSSIAGGVVGGIGGGVVAGPLGAIAGSILGSTALMGMGTYGQTYSEARKTMSEEDARDLAAKTTAWELGPELATNILTFGVGGKLIKDVAKAGLNATIKKIATTSPKELIGSFAAIAGTETSGEMLTAYQQASLREEAGLPTAAPTEAALEAFGPAFVMSLMFWGGAEGYSLNQQRQLKNSLTSENLFEREAAISIIDKNLRKQDPEVADQWQEYTKSVDRINIEDEFVNIAKDIKKEEVKVEATISTETLLSNLPEDQAATKAYVDKELQQVISPLSSQEVRAEKATVLEKRKEAKKKLQPLVQKPTPTKAIQPKVEGVPDVKPLLGTRKAQELEAFEKGVVEQEAARVVPIKPATTEQVIANYQKEVQPEYGTKASINPQDVTVTARDRYEQGIVDGTRQLDITTETLAKPVDQKIGEVTLKDPKLKTKAGADTLKIVSEESPTTNEKYKATITSKAGTIFTGLGNTHTEARADVLQKFSTDTISPASRGVLRQKPLPTKDIRTKEARLADREVLRSAATGEDLITVGNTLAKKGSMLSEVSSYLKGIAGKKQLRDIKVKIVKGSRATYNRATNTITVGEGLNTRGKEILSQAVIHEVTHALTVLKYQRGGYLATRINELHQEALDNLSVEDKANLKKWTPKKFNEEIDNFEKEFSNYSPNVYYGLLNPREFMAMMTTNKDFQDYLKSVKIDKPTSTIKTLWDRFVSVMGKVFGVKPGDYNILSEALTVQDKMIRDKLTEGELSDIEMNRLAEEMKDTDFYPAKSQTASAIEKPAKPKMTQEERTAIIVKGIKGKESVKEKIIDNVKQLGKLSQDLFQGTSERLGEFNTKFQIAMQKFERIINVSNKENMEDSRKFNDWYEGLNEENKALVKDRLSNRDFAGIGELFSKNPEGKKAFTKVQRMLERIEESAYRLGLIRDKLPNYFPRHVKDIDGLVEWMQKRDDKELGKFNYLIQKKERVLGRKLSNPEITQIYVEALKTGRYGALPKPGSTQERTITNIHPDAQQFYSSPVEALMNHIYEMNTKIAGEELIGSSKRPKLVKELRAIEKNLVSDKLSEAERAKLIEQAEKIDSELSDSEQLIESSIADDIANSKNNEGKDLTTSDQREIIRLIRGRLMEKGMHGPLSKARNVALMMTLGNMSSAITQLGDVAFSVYSHGWGNAISGMMDAVQGEKGSKIIDNFDFSQQHKEWATGTSTKGLDKLLSMTGLKKMDLFGKESFLKARQRKIKGGGVDSFIKKYSKFADGDKAALTEAYEAISNNTIKDNGIALDVMFSSLSQYQPLSISEMPYNYMIGGNLRGFYILKSFALKALNTVAREAKKGYKEGGIKGSIKKAGYLFTLLTLAGAGTDEIKDFLVGRETSFSDNVIENIFQLLMLNKYSLEKGVQSGDLLQSIVMGQAPPMRFLTDGGKDLYSMATGEAPTNFIKYLPVIGRQIYSRGTDVGRSKVIEGEKRGVTSLAEGREVNKKVNQFNKGKKKEDKISKINLSKLQAKIRKGEI